MDENLNSWSWGASANSDFSRLMRDTRQVVQMPCGTRASWKSMTSEIRFSILFSAPGVMASLLFCIQRMHIFFLLWQWFLANVGMVSNCLIFQSNLSLLFFQIKFQIVKCNLLFKHKDNHNYLQHLKQEFVRNFFSIH